MNPFLIFIEWKNFVLSGQELGSGWYKQKSCGSIQENYAIDSGYEEQSYETETLGQNTGM